MNLAARAFRAFTLIALLLAASATLADDSLRVMSFNIRYGTARDGENAWTKRAELLLKTIRGFDPDLLGTQEVLAMQAEFLTNELPGYRFVGVGRDDGKRSGEFSAVMFKSERFEPVGEGTFWLSETPEEPGSKSWDSSLPRIVTWVKLRDRKVGGRELFFVNTHWDHIGNKARTESGAIIRRWLSEKTHGLPTIVTGDLNVREDHPGIKALLATDSEPQLRDVFRALHAERADDEATFHGFSGRTRGGRIDFIFATTNLTPREASIDHTSTDNRFPSDHFPVTAVLEYSE